MSSVCSYVCLARTHEKLDWSFQYNIFWENLCTLFQERVAEGCENTPPPPRKNTLIHHKTFYFFKTKLNGDTLHLLCRWPISPSSIFFLTRINMGQWLHHKHQPAVKFGMIHHPNPVLLIHGHVYIVGVGALVSVP